MLHLWWMCVCVSQHRTLQLYPCFISLNKWQFKYSDRGRHISVPSHFPEQKVVYSHSSNKPLSCRCSQGGHQLFSHPPLASEKLFKFIIIYKVNTHNAKVSLWCGSVFEASVTYIADMLCARWGRDRLGNYPCLMNTKIRIWLKSTEMARQQVRDAPGELWAAQIYPQAFLKKIFFFFWISIVGCFEPRMVLALKASPSPSPSPWHDASG